MQINDLMLIPYSLCVPLVAACIAAIIPYRNIRDGLMVLVSLLLPCFVYKIYQLMLAGTGIPQWQLFELIPGLAINFKIEPLGLIFALILSILWTVSLIYSIGYMRGNKLARQNSFFAYFCLTIFAGLGLAFSGNLLTLFVFYEFITLTTYPLVIYDHTKEAKKAGRLYIGTLIGASILFFLPAIIFSYNIAGTLNFIPGGIFDNKVSSAIMMFLLVLYVLGIAKTALMPLHKWLPAAMVAPVPVSALLHAVVVVKAGVFSLAKIIVYIFGIDNLARISMQMGQYGDWLLYLSGFTIITASLIALYKDNLKQLLAYSTISQLAYVIMALAMFSPKGLNAAIFQIITHAFAKITMFFTIGSIYTASHKKKISQINGIGKSMPFSMAAFAIAALSLIGLPPAAGFFAKWYILDSSLEAESYFALSVIAISTMLNAAYFLPILYKAFFAKDNLSKGKVVLDKHFEAPILMVIATLFTAGILLLLFIWPNYIQNIAAMIELNVK